MFNWLKKNAVTEKVAPEPDVTAIQSGDSTTLSAISESEMLKNQGNAHLSNGKLEDAAECYRRAIARNPRYAEAYSNLGYVFEAQGNLEEAVAHYRKAIEFNPNLLPAHQNLGFALLNLGQRDAAEESLRRVIALTPEHTTALQSLGVIAAQRGDFLQAETLLRHAIELQPDYVDAHNNLGNLLMEAKRLPEAEAFYRRALELQPDNASAHYNLGNLLMKANRLPEAEASYRHALELKPDYAGALYNLGLLLLSLGRYAEAWPYYEHRYDPNLEEPICKIPTLSYPQWQGEPLAGKSLVILCEQGFGDHIQFARYAQLLKQSGVSRLTFLCAPPLKALLETMAGVDAIITELLPTTPYDYWSFPLSLPFHFGTTLDTIPATLPYLNSLPTRVAQWRGRLPMGKLKVGLVWKGNVNHKNDANRSLPGLHTLAPLWSVPGVNFVSLQKWQGENEAKNPPVDQSILHLGTDIGDFADTAAIVSQLDIVICVDTAIAHLAGAMGKPCWVLLPAFDTDWRWLREREDSPWYASMRLFRQQDSGDWDRPVERIRQALFSIAHAGS